LTLFGEGEAEEETARSLSRDVRLLRNGIEGKNTSRRGDSIDRSPKSDSMLALLAQPHTSLDRQKKKKTPAATNTTSKSKNGEIRENMSMGHCQRGALSNRAPRSWGPCHCCRRRWRRMGMQWRRNCMGRGGMGVRGGIDRAG